MRAPQRMQQRGLKPSAAMAGDSVLSGWRRGFLEAQGGIKLVCCEGTEIDSIYIFPFVKEHLYLHDASLD